jgi:hypothetical protein
MVRIFMIYSSSLWTIVHLAPGERVDNVKKVCKNHQGCAFKASVNFKMIMHQHCASPDRAEYHSISQYVFNLLTALSSTSARLFHKPSAQVLHANAGVIAASLPAAALILWLYRDQLMGPIPDYSKVLATVSEYKVTDWDLMAKSGALRCKFVTYLCSIVLCKLVRHACVCVLQCVVFDSMPRYESYRAPLLFNFVSGAFACFSTIATAAAALLQAT